MHGFLLLFLLLLSGCAARPGTPDYQAQYAHLRAHKPLIHAREDSSCFLLILVNARHLDYSNGKGLLRTLVKHPDDGSKNCDVGHAWILLKGVVDGKSVVVEGGHSGELGIRQPRYFDGIMNYIEYGWADPSQEQMCLVRHEPNPVRYLWEIQRDGFFQAGSGGHRPTYALKVNLSEEQFRKILHYISPEQYDYSRYAITGKQCASFAAGAAELAGLSLESEVTVPLPSKVVIGGVSCSLWEDPAYSELTICSPDILEKSMMHAVEEGRAEYALPYYLKRWKKRQCPRCHFNRLVRTISLFPYRYMRAKSLESPG